MKILCDIRKLRTLNNYVDTLHFTMMYFEDKNKNKFISEQDKEVI